MKLSPKLPKGYANKVKERDVASAAENASSAVDDELYAFPCYK